MIMPNSDHPQTVRRSKARARLLMRTKKGTYTESDISDLIRNIKKKNISVETILQRLAKSSRSSTLTSRLKEAVLLTTLKPSYTNSHNLSSNSSVNVTDPCEFNNTTRYRCAEMAQTLNTKWASIIVGLTFIPGIVFCLLFCRYVPEQYLKLTQDG